MSGEAGQGLGSSVLALAVPAAASLPGAHLPPTSWPRTACFAMLLFVNSGYMTSSRRVAAQMVRPSVDSVQLRQHTHSLLAANFRGNSCVRTSLNIYCSIHKHLRASASTRNNRSINKRRVKHNLAMRIPAPECNPTFVNWTKRVANFKHCYNKCLHK